MQAVHDAHDDSENFLELLNSRTLAPELFAEPPACDYLKKMEYGSSHGGGGWPEHQFTAAALEKHLSSGYGAAVAHHHHHAAAGAPERLTANLSDLVSNWSIAPPNPCLGDARHRAGAGAACDNAAVAALGHGAKAGLFLDSGGLCKHEMGGHGAMLQEAGGGSGAGGQEFLRPAGYSSMLGLSSSRMYGSGPAVDVPWGNDAGAARSLSDLISFGGAPLGKPEQPAPTAPKAQAEYKKQGQEISSPVRTTTTAIMQVTFPSEQSADRSECFFRRRRVAAAAARGARRGRRRDRRSSRGRMGTPRSPRMRPPRPRRLSRYTRRHATNHAGLVVHLFDTYIFLLHTYILDRAELARAIPKFSSIAPPTPLTIKRRSVD
jgi:hypothetical protein